MGRLLLLGICLCVSTAAGQNIRLVDVFPFGPGEGDATVPSGNDAAVTVALDVPIMFYGELRQSIIVGFIYIFGRGGSKGLHTETHVDYYTCGVVIYLSL